MYVFLQSHGLKKCVDQVNAGGRIPIKNNAKLSKRTFSATVPQTMPTRQVVNLLEKMRKRRVVVLKRAITQSALSLSSTIRITASALTIDSGQCLFLGRIEHLGMV